MRMPRFRNSPARRSSSNTPKWNSDLEPVGPAIGALPVGYRVYHNYAQIELFIVRNRQNRSRWNPSGYRQLRRQILSIGSQAANHGVPLRNCVTISPTGGIMKFRTIRNRYSGSYF